MAKKVFLLLFAREIFFVKKIFLVYCVIYKNGVKGLTFLFNLLSPCLKFPCNPFGTFCSTSVFSSIEPYWIALDAFHNTRSARASVIPRRQSSHLQIDVDKSEMLSAFWESPSENNELFESIEFVRGKPWKIDPSTESSPVAPKDYK